MKKLSLLLVSALLLTACKQTVQQARVETGSQTQEQAMNEFGKVAAAIQAGKPVSCTLTKTDGSGTMSYKMMGKKVRVNGMTEGKDGTGSMISDGMYMYTWDDVKKTGMKFKLPDEKEVKETVQQTQKQLPSLTSEEDKKKYEDQGYRVDCQETSVSESDFVPPSDVNFTDTSAMMEKVSTMMQVDPSKMTPEQQKALEDQAAELEKQFANQ